MASPPESPTDDPTDDDVRDVGADDEPEIADDEDGATAADVPALDDLPADTHAAADADGAPSGAGRSRDSVADDWDTDLDVPLVTWGGADTDDDQAEADDGNDVVHSDAAYAATEDASPEHAASVEEIRARRRRWRRRRRLIGVFAFLAVVAILGVVVARATGVGDSDEKAERTTTTVPSTTSTVPPAGPYRVLDGLNARSGPGPAFPAVGTVRVGEQVMVTCVADGPLVSGPTGQSTKWLKVETPFGAVFLAAAYVAVGPDLNNPDKIASCPGG